MIGVEDQGVADVAEHLVPDLALVGAHVDAHAADRGVDDLEVALDVGVGVGVEDGAALRVEDHARSPGRRASAAQVLPVSSLRQMPPVGPLMAA